MNLCNKCSYWNQELINGFCLPCLRIININEKWKDYYLDEVLRPRKVTVVSFKEVADIREFKKGELHYFPKRRKVPKKGWGK